MMHHRRFIPLEEHEPVDEAVDEFYTDTDEQPEFSRKNFLYMAS